MKLDYKVNNSWSLGHRRPRRMRRHVLAMSVCAVVTFIGYTKFSSEQQPQDESSWSIPGGVMAAYPVLDTPQRVPQSSRQPEATSRQAAGNDRRAGCQ
ncbi:MAG: hypothetical protein U5P41_14330 [Gammaproteobacteria bacterium]|nr:hypothetical protein [Gammaproteobacteria bacterium]